MNPVQTIQIIGVNVPDSVWCALFLWLVFKAINEAMKMVRGK